eukprot:scaffold71708_cov58-Phaeocystis_antarctica.AAC.2
MSASSGAALRQSSVARRAKPGAVGSRHKPGDSLTSSSNTMAAPQPPGGRASTCSGIGLGGVFHCSLRVSLF